MRTVAAVSAALLATAAAAAFDLKTALDGKAEWWKVRQAVLDFVNAD